MKMNVINETSVRVLRTAAALSALALLLAGCVVTSVYPFYTEKDLVSDPAFLGEWAETSSNATPGEYLRVEQAGDKSYIVTCFGPSKTNRWEAHLFQLKGQLFVDTCATNRSLDSVPTHQLSKVLHLESGLETADLNYDWLAQLLENNPRALRHLVLHDQPGDKGRIVLTADTAELQRFVLKHLNDTNAWESPSELKQRP